jgi:predicted metal-dependent phosphoesterase TrpH
MLAFDFHIHTAESPDSKIKIIDIINKCNKYGLNAVAITDHNKISKEVLKLNLKNSKIPINIIVGEEISTDKGEIIGLFLKKEIKPGKAEEVVEEIKSQDALVYLPHPFKRSTIVKYSEIVKEVDIVEVWNCRTSYEQNYKALLFAQEKNILFSCGSDAHFAFEIGRCKNIVEGIPIKEKELEKETLIEMLKKYRCIMKGINKNYIIYESISQFLKSFKQRNLKSFKHALLFPIFEFLLGRSRAFKIDIENSSLCKKINILPLEQ